ncbi:type IV secretory system conjugative DNA transfer family protein [Gemmata obscuriglobus]|nr:type IV secretion system DNA-binding domain-containing protein [Gemmata obscuriglobus]
MEVLRHGIRFIGSPGSGKSVMLKALRATLATIIKNRPDYDILAVDFDGGKRDLYEIFRLFPQWAPVFDLNPFLWGDRYDFMGDLEDPRDIAQMAANIIEVREKDSQPYFPQAAQHVFRAAMLRHWLVTPGRATTRDVFLSGMSANNIRRVIGSHPQSRHALPLVNRTESGLSVISTLMNEVGKYEYVASLWDSNDRGRTVTIRSFLKQRFALLSLPYDDKSVATLAAVVRYLLVVLQQRALSTVVRNRYLLLLLDELALLPGGINLDLTLVKGRETGICPLFAYQSHSHCRTVHGKEKFDAMTGLMKTTIVLNQPSREDAEYCAKVFSDQQGFMKFNSAQGGKNPSTGWSEQLTTVENVTAAMIQSLPVPTPATPFIEGFMVTLPFRPFRFRVRIPDLLKALVPTVAPQAPPAPRDPKDFLLRPWSEDDYKRLGLPRPRN